MRDEWYVARRGQEGARRYGPVPKHELRGLINSGRVQGEDLVWRDGMAEWQRADQCPDLRPAAPQRQGNPPPGGYGRNPAPPAYQPSNPYPRPYAPPSSSGRVVPLVIGLSVLLVGGLAFGGFLCSTAFRPAPPAYSTPTYYQPATPVWNPPVAPDPAPEWPPADPPAVDPNPFIPQPPVVDPNPPDPLPNDPVPPPDARPDPP